MSSKVHRRPGRGAPGRPAIVTLGVVALACAMPVSARGAERDPAPGSDRPTKNQAKAGSSDDPGVDVLCRAAVALALAEPDRALSFVHRARLAGWLPEMHFRAYRRFARTEGLTYADTGTGTVAPVDISAVDDFRYEWRASWDLSRMVFNPDELQAHLEALRMSDARRDIQSLVIKLYFERKRLLLESDDAGDSGGAAAMNKDQARDKASQKRALRILEIETELDAMSGGAFSESASSQRQAMSTQ